MKQAVRKRWVIIHFPLCAVIGACIDARAVTHLEVVPPHVKRAKCKVAHRINDAL